MQFIVRVTIPNAPGNTMVKGNPQTTFDKIMADVRPEAAYFAVDKGQRTLYLVVNVERTSELPRVAEPFWLALGADVEFIPAMSAQDFGEAAGTIATIAAKY